MSGEISTRRRLSRTSARKSSHRTHAEIKSLLDAISGILAGEQEQITIRHLFYCLVGLGQIEKTERAYHSLCGHLARWRRSGKIPWDAFVGSTRWHLGTDTFDDIDAVLKNTAECYRKNLWAQQPAYVEIWCEKDAISGILNQEASTFGVRVFVCRGFASLSSLYAAAQTFKEATANGKEVFVFYFGDHDPSGLDIDRATKKTLREDFGVEVNFTRASITPAQIKKFNLPTRPTKESNHSKNWRGGDSVEVDTMSSADLKTIVRNCITKHIDQRQWKQLQGVEKNERRQLEIVAGKWRKI